MAHKPLFAFFGTPYIATIVLDQLEARGMLPALVVTAPDRPVGRGLTLTPSPVKKWALERGIDVATPEKLSDPAFIAEIQNTDWDVFVVSMYAKLIPKKVLDMPRRGCLNVHPSLLPKFRGPSPVLSAILADEKDTGVTIMQLSEKMDEGPIIAQASIELEEETADEPGWPPKGSEFEKLLSQEGGTLLAEVLPKWVAGTIPAEEQDHTQATYTKKFTDEDALLHQEATGGQALPVATTGEIGRENFLKIRAFDASPKPYFISKNGKRVIVKEAKWQDGKLVITRVTPEGKKEMDYQDFLRGQQ